jgi:hypothetical protein
MIKLFKQNGILQMIVIAIVSVVLWGRSFLAPQAMMPCNSFAPLYTILYEWLQPLPLVATIIAYVLVVLEGVYLNMVLTRNKMVPFNSLMPALIYIVSMSFNQHPLTLTPFILAAPCVITVLNQLLILDKMNISNDNILNAAFFSALATLLCLPCIVLLLFVIVGLMVHSQYRWRCWLMVLIGYIAPLLIAATYYFLTDRLYYISYITFNDILNPSLLIEQSTGLTAFDNVMFITFLVLSGLMTFSRIREHSVVFRRNAEIILILLLVLAASLWYTRIMPFDAAIGAIPFAFLASNCLLTARKRLWILETLLIIFILFAII